MAIPLKIVLGTLGSGTVAVGGCGVYSVATGKPVLFFKGSEKVNSQREVVDQSNASGLGTAVTEEAGQPSTDVQNPPVIDPTTQDPEKYDSSIEVPSNKQEEAKKLLTGLDGKCIFQFKNDPQGNELSNGIDGLQENEIHDLSTKITEAKDKHCLTDGSSNKVLFQLDSSKQTWSYSLVTPPAPVIKPAADSVPEVPPAKETKTLTEIQKKILDLMKENSDKFDASCVLMVRINGENKKIENVEDDNLSKLYEFLNDNKDQNAICPILASKSVDTPKPGDYSDVVQKVTKEGVETWEQYSDDGAEETKQK